MSPLLNKISSSSLDLSEVWTGLRSVYLLCLLALSLCWAELSCPLVSSAVLVSSISWWLFALLRGSQGELNVCQQINNLPALDGFSLSVLSFTLCIPRQPWRVGRWVYLKMSSIKMNRNTIAPLLAVKLFSKFLMQAVLLLAAPPGDHFTIELRAVPFYYKFWSQKTWETSLVFWVGDTMLQHLPNLFDQHTQMEKKARKKWECKF